MSFPHLFPVLVKVALQSYFDSPNVCEETHGFTVGSLDSDSIY